MVESMQQPRTTEAGLSGENHEDVDTPVQRLADLGLVPIDLPVFGTFVSVVQINDILHTMGHWPLDGSQAVTGKLGSDLDVEEGRDAARLAALALIGSLAAHLGDLDQVRRIVSVLVTVNATPTFTEHTSVADAASELLVAVFGDRGRHARLAVGVSSLPADLALELTAVVQVHPAGVSSQGH
jgi:enamine deaminase RidA (YjgF/YER057c/UK114 family)